MSLDAIRARLAAAQPHLDACEIGAARRLVNGERVGGRGWPLVAALARHSPADIAALLARVDHLEGRVRLVPVRRPRSLWRPVRRACWGAHALAWEAIADDRGPYRLTFDGEAIRETWDRPPEGWIGEATACAITLDLAAIEDCAESDDVRALYAAAWRAIIYRPALTGGERERSIRADLAACRALPTTRASRECERP